MDVDLIAMLLGGVVAGGVIVVGFLLGVLWASKWD
jgi:hypothetical protein